MPQLYDPRAYRKRSTPIDRKLAGENAAKFTDAVRQAMEDFHIADCLIVAEINTILAARDLMEEDSEVPVTMCAHIGDFYRAAPMGAYANAYMRKEFEALMDRRKASGAEDGRGHRGEA